MPAEDNLNVTRLLSDMAEGCESAAARLLPLVYADLHELARAYFGRQEGGHTLQPTALVHEAFLKLADSGSRWKNRTHFCAVAASAMRQILIDHARRKKAEKRGGLGKRVTLSDFRTPDGKGEVDIVVLDEILTRLKGLDSRQYRIVEMRFFGGLSENEIAEVIGVSRTTVQTEWRTARAWLGMELKKADLP